MKLLLIGRLESEALLDFIKLRLHHMSTVIRMSTDLKPIRDNGRFIGNGSLIYFDKILLGNEVNREITKIRKVRVYILECGFRTAMVTVKSVDSKGKIRGSRTFNVKCTTLCRNNLTILFAYFLK